MSRLIPIAIVIAALIATAAPRGGRAAELDVPPAASKDSKDLSVHVGPPACRRWTDDCVTCTREAAGSAPACSNIGIACQPKELRCIESDDTTNAPAAK